MTRRCLVIIVSTSKCAANIKYTSQSIFWCVLCLLNSESYIPVLVWLIQEFCCLLEVYSFKLNYVLWDKACVWNQEELFCAKSYHSLSNNEIIVITIIVRLHFKTQYSTRPALPAFSRTIGVVFNTPVRPHLSPNSQKVHF